ncbi:sulfite exporter TauE/SafE family protein [Methylocapsa sp. S129]|uniref:sulfite exporter TauE/SafE family protein n=1 Tax=Methylocapsa sp. S129 TaxID=1641869 RepID=UPI00131BCF66|nr:sulfite exporter TauE/SafE family protein [Methylocapsa sp. S129]
MPLSELLVGVGVGLVGGVTSGLLGVSPGGGLAIFSILLLGFEQHVAQGVSLFAQIAPTSISGIKRYRQGGSRTPMHWLALLAAGFIVGGVAGALAAGGASSGVLRWTYVVYLAALDGLLIFRRRRQEDSSDRATPHMGWGALLGIGAIAGFSSGFLGIGGGLAITVGLSAGFGVGQRQAQLASLVLSMIPTTIPAAWVYWREGWSASWPVIGGVVLGLWVGTDLGARMANKVSETALHRALVGFVTAIALYMAYKALA